MTAGFKMGFAFDIGTRSGGGGSGLPQFSGSVPVMAIGSSRVAFSDSILSATDHRRRGSAAWFLAAMRPQLRFESVYDAGRRWGVISLGPNDTVAQTNGIATTSGQATVTMSFAAAHGLVAGNMVFVQGAAVVAGLDLNNRWRRVLTAPTTTTLTFNAETTANATVSAGGGTYTVYFGNARGGAVTNQDIFGSNVGSAGDHAQGTLDLTNPDFGDANSGLAITMNPSALLILMDSYNNNVNSYNNRSFTVETVKQNVSRLKALYPTALIVIFDGGGRQRRERVVISNTDPFTTTNASAVVTVNWTDHNIITSTGGVAAFSAPWTATTQPVFSSAINAGAVTGFSIVNAGAGISPDGTYNLAAISSGSTGNSSAYGTATVSGGIVTSVALTDGGTGWGTAPGSGSTVKWGAILMLRPLVVNGIDVARKAWTLPAPTNGDVFTFTALNTASAGGSGGGSGVFGWRNMGNGWDRATEDGETRWAALDAVRNDLAAFYIGDPLVRVVDVPAMRAGPDGSSPNLTTRDGVHYSELGGYLDAQALAAAVDPYLAGGQSFERDPTVAGNLFSHINPTLATTGGTVGAGGTGSAPLHWQISRTGANVTWASSIEAAGPVSRWKIAYNEVAGAQVEPTTLRPVSSVYRSRTITPATPFRTVNGSQLVTVNQAAHGFVPGGTVVITSSGAAIGGLSMDGTWTIFDVPSTGTFRFTHSSAATSTVTVGTGQPTPTIVYDAASVIPTGRYHWGLFLEQDAWPYWRGFDALLAQIDGGVTTNRYSLGMWANGYRFWPRNAMSGTTGQTPGIWIKSNPFDVVANTTQFTFSLIAYTEMVAGAGVGNLYISRPFFRPVT